LRIVIQCRPCHGLMIMQNREQDAKKGPALSPGEAPERSIQRRKPLNASKHACLVTLFKILVKGKHHYITPSRSSVLQILEKRYHIEIKTRWLGECIRDLVKRGFIRRKRRWKHIEFAEIRSIPSMITLTPSGVSYLNTIGLSGASEVWQRTLNWIKKGDARFPFPEDGNGLTPDAANQAGMARQRRPSDIVEHYERTKPQAALARLAEIIEKIG
jgi:hypothetical protein